MNNSTSNNGRPLRPRRQYTLGDIYGGQPIPEDLSRADPRLSIGPAAPGSYSGAPGALPKPAPPPGGKAVQVPLASDSRDDLEARVQRVLMMRSHDTDLEQETHRERTRRQARRAVDAEERADLPVGDPVLLEDLKADPVTYLVEGILPRDEKTTLIAQNKTGKTTLLLNLTRSLTTGEPFLGHYAAERISGRVLYLNYELSDAKFQEEAQRMGIDASKVVVFQGRKYSNPFSHKEQRERIVDVALQHDIEVVIVDPLSNAFAYADQDSNSQMSVFLREVWQLVADTGAKTMVIAAHSGKDGSKGARGAGAIEGDPDVIIRLNKTSGGHKRQFAIEGRHPEDHVQGVKMDYDAETHLLSLTRPEVPQEEAELLIEMSDAELLAELVRERPGISRADLEADFPVGRQRFRAAWMEVKAQAEGDPDNAPVRIEAGQNRKLLCYPRDAYSSEVGDPAWSDLF